MFDFYVRRNNKYMELNIVGVEGTLQTGLLDDAEAIEVAIRLIWAAEELLPVEYNEQDRLLGEIRESLSE